MEQNEIASTEVPQEEAETAVFQLKGSALTLTTLELLDANLEQLDKQLAIKVAQAPDFFCDAPLILSLGKRADTEQVPDLAELIAICRRHGLRTLALRSDLDIDREAANALDLPLLPESLARDRPPAREPVIERVPVIMPAMVINTPVRSGQQIYAKNADLIVTASVGAGSELLADGNIHVYGALRGRALAGAKGNLQARIFCQNLGAELISIAGQYKIAEDLRRLPAWGSAVQVHLDEQQMHIQSLD